MNAQEFEALYRQESRKVHATLIRLLRDFDLAEEATQEAFEAALKSWPEQGVPKNPTSWLISTGRFKAIDKIRRRSRLSELEPHLASRDEEIQQRNAALEDLELPDDRLRLIFTCCHPAIDPQAQIPLTLREVCGLTTSEIAKAFLTNPVTMAQRIVRAKAKIKAAGIPYTIPELHQLPERLEPVLRVIYLVFNEGYSASSGDSLTRPDVSGEAIRLARLLLELLPESEVKGLLALMLFHESRRTARSDARGDIVLLKDQDRGLWDRAMIAEADQLLAGTEVGTYTLQAAISGVHASAASYDQTDWNQIVALYQLLERFEPSPVVALNRAVAVSMVRGPQAGLDLIDEILQAGFLLEYSLAHSARGEMLAQLQRKAEAVQALAKARELTTLDSEKRFLQSKIEGLGQ